MKFRFVMLLAGAAVLAAGTFQAPAEDAKDPKKQLESLVGDVREKLKEGQNTEEALAPELKRFDELLAEHKGEKTDEVAEILLMKALLYAQVFEQPEKAIKLLKDLQTQFAETEIAKNAEQMIAGIERSAEAMKARAALAVGKKFPDFEVKDLEGDPLSVGKYKGKVVLIDFWATWCGPCIAELPNVLETYEKYHDKGFEIIGISLDRNREALTGFIERKEMTWPQFFDGKNELAEKYGVNSIPATFLLDGEGIIVAKDLRGEALEREVGKLVN